MSKELSAQHAAVFEARGISADTAVKFGVHSGKWLKNGETSEVVPDPGGNVVIFPFNENGKEVGAKWRWTDRETSEKRFAQPKGGKQIFWNADILDDPSLEAGTHALIITEGEPDGLTADQCGWPHVVSVPCGAPAVKEGDNPFELPELGEESTGKFGFLWSAREKLAKVKRIVIAVDNDPPGLRLGAELVRRLGIWRCHFVTYPAGCKDLNDVLRKHGPEEVSRVLNGAKPYPVRGLYKLDDYPEAQQHATITTGWSTVDEHIKPFPGMFMVVTGIPGHGKSTWVMNMLCNAAKHHQWRSAVFSPEMPTVPYMRDALRKMMQGDGCDTVEYADRIINEYFTFIDTDPNGSEDEDFTLDWIIERATDAVLRDGANCLVIDPWNEVEHAKEKGETMTDYVGRGIRALKRFARQYGVAVIVVAHPTKDVAKDGKARAVTLYDIADSSHWFNKCDFGVVVDRAPQWTAIQISKVRFAETGARGTVNLEFDRYLGKYDLLDPNKTYHPGPTDNASKKPMTRKVGGVDVPF